MIRTLHLKNFKCFPNELIHLSNLNLLTGLNGMGKSSVIQSLLLLRQNYESGLLHLKKELALNGEYLEIGNSADLLYVYFDKKEIGISLITNTEKNFGWVWDAGEKVDSMKEIWNGGNEDLNSESLFNNQFHYLNAERIGPRPYYLTSPTKVKHQNQLGVKGEFAAEYFLDNRYKEIIPALVYDKKISPTIYEQVNAWMEVIRPGTKINVYNYPEAGVNSLFFQFLLGRDNPGSFKSNNVGFGLTYVFPLMVAILASTPNTLLLIENPEAHIHPKGQAELGILLAKAAAAGVQVIVETHSDHILNGIRYAIKENIINNELTRIMFFTGVISEDRFKHYIDYIQINKQGKLDHRPDDFFDVWDKMLTKLI